MLGNIGDPAPHIRGITYTELGRKALGRVGTPSTASPLFSGRMQVVLSAVSIALVAAVLAAYGATATAAAYAFFVFVGVQLSAIDLRLRILPNRLVLPAIGIGLVLLVVAAVVDGAGSSGEPGAGRVLRVVMGGAVLFAVFLALALISPRGMGMGDVKLAGFVGMYLAFDGWQTLLLGTAASFLLAALVGVALLVLRRAQRTSAIPFGPLMFLGAALALAW